MSENFHELVQEQISVLSEDEMELVYQFVQGLRSKNGGADSRPISEIARELSSKVPYEEWAKLPRDGAENYKHYLYGHPKKP